MDVSWGPRQGLESSDPGAGAGEGRAAGESKGKVRKLRLGWFNAVSKKESCPDYIYKQADQIDICLRGTA